MSFVIKNGKGWWNGGGYWSIREDAQIFPDAEAAAQEIRERAADMVWHGGDNVITIDES